jgi:hypothetical protein
VVWEYQGGIEDPVRFVDRSSFLPFFALIVSIFAFAKLILRMRHCEGPDSNATQQAMLLEEKKRSLWFQ